jgi:cysteine desulfuration protein SufE
MGTGEQQLPPRLEEIVDEFRWAEGREKLELLLEYSRQMPELPERLRAARDTMEQVHECMTPVFVLAEREDQGLHYYFDIPQEAPTVRGYAGVLGLGLEGAQPEEVLQIPGNFYEEMGLQDVLTPRRLNGAHAMLAYLKRLATRELTMSEHVAQHTT